MFRAIDHLKLSVKLNVVIVLAFAVLLTAVIIVSSDKIEDLTFQTGQNRAEQEMGVIQARFAEAEANVLLAAQQLAVASDLVEAIITENEASVYDRILVRANSLDLDYISIINANGESLLTFTEIETPFNQATMAALIRSSLSGVETTSLISEAAGETPMFLLAAVVPLRDISGVIVGGLLAGRHIDDDFLAQLNFDREDIHVAVVRDNHIVVQHVAHAIRLHSEEEMSHQDEHQDEMDDGMLRFQDFPLEQTYINHALNGRVIILNTPPDDPEVPKHILAYAPLTIGGETPAVLSILIRQDELLLFQDQLIIDMAAIFTIIVVTVIAVVAIFARYSITNPIDKLMRTAQQMADGDYSQRVHITTSGEVGQLAHAFNEMAGSIQSHEQKLQATNTSLNHEIAERKQVEIALREAKEQAEAATEAKSQFLANMSHELRTPLNAIINFSYLLSIGSEGPLTEEQGNLINRIGDAGHHLLNLINNVLDLAKIESGQLELYFDEVNLNDLFNSAVSTTKGLLGNKSIEFRQEIPDELLLVKADHTRIQQVLLNLLSNAVKFTEQGTITLRAVADDDWVTISVVDTGVGVATEDISRMFEEFVQLDGGLARQAGGTGLGLAISKQFVEMHKGQMWAESQVGKGSVFYFTLPRLSHSAWTGDVEKTEEPLNVRVLVIDDDPTTRETLIHQLTPGYQVLKVTNSSQSLNIVRESQPDVVLVDVLMPYQDGWDVLKKLKMDPDTKDIPVVVCSILHEQKTALSFGANGYLVKPINHQDLQQTVSQFAPTGGKVLAVDDDPDVLDIISRMLRGLTYQVNTATNGKEGLAAAQTELPDLIVLDLMMPEMSGFEVLAELRADPRTADLPVVIVTAKDLTAAEREMLQSKAALLLRKGQFTPGEFAQTIQRVVKQIAVNKTPETET